MKSQPGPEMNATYLEWQQATYSSLDILQAAFSEADACVKSEHDGGGDKC